METLTETVTSQKKSKPKRKSTNAEEAKTLEQTRQEEEEQTEKENEEAKKKSQELEQVGFQLIKKKVKIIANPLEHSQGQEQDKVQEHPLSGSQSCFNQSEWNY